MIKGLSKHLFKSMVDFVYPPLCLHCENFFEQDMKIFCRQCMQGFELIDPKGLCFHCFQRPKAFRGLCQECLRFRFFWVRQAACFEYKGPLITFLKFLKYRGYDGFAKGAAAFMAYQYFKLNWPIPDLIVPVPQDFLKRIQRGYNQSALLAQELSFLLKVPYYPVLFKRLGAYSQTSLSLKKRRGLSSKSFFLNKKNQVQDKVILLVDDVRTTGKTLEVCIETLHKGFPKKIYALTLCQGMSM